MKNKNKKYVDWIGNTEKNWQKEYINDLFNVAKQNGDKQIILSDDKFSVFQQEKPKLPNALVRFYNADSRNIEDVINKKLFLQDPKYFNDPFDCKIGYNKPIFLKRFLLNEIKKEISKQDFLSHEVYDKINCYKPGTEQFNKAIDSFIRNDLQKVIEEKCDFYKEPNHTWYDKTMQKAEREFNKIIPTLKHTKYRVACFIPTYELKRTNYIFGGNNYVEIPLEHPSMWAHYADNGKGFCVEYHIGYDLDEAQTTCIRNLKSSLFPLMYSSRRPNLDTRLSKNSKNKELELERAFLLSCLTKSPYWSKEQEYRLLLDENNSLLQGNKVDFPFIHCIYLGYNMSKKHRYKLVAFGEENKLSVRDVVPRCDKYFFDETYYTLLKYSRFKLNTEII